MAFWVPIGSEEFLWQTSNIVGVQPAANIGSIVTPGNNTKGSYTSILSSGTVTRDVYGLWINVNSNAVSAAVRSALLDIGVDPAGGTSFSVLVPDLLVSNASPITTGGGIHYYFPIFIRAGSSVGARASVNNATVGTMRVVLKVFGSPKDRRHVRVGSYVTAFGATGGTSTGTAVTAGTTSDGNWTQLGSSSVRPHWWWQLGMGFADSTMTARHFFADLSYGDGSNKHIVIQNQAFLTDGTERITTWGRMRGCGRYVASGNNIYGRLQNSGTNVDSGSCMMAYGLGG